MLRLSPILSRPWFRRRWVLQEVAFNPNVVMHCGKHKLSWNWFREAVRILHAELYGKDSQSSSLTTEASYALQSVAVLRPKSQSLMELLFSCHLSQCGDNSDRLFSLYSIASWKDEPLLNPYLCCPIDYSQHWAKTYTQYAVAALKAGQCYEIFSHLIDFGNLSKQNPDWPSWVPSWNQGRLHEYGARSLAMRDSTERRIRSFPEFVQIGAREGLQLVGRLLQVQSPHSLAQKFRGVVIPENESIMSQLSALAKTKERLDRLDRFRSRRDSVDELISVDGGSPSFILRVMFHAESLL